MDISCNFKKIVCKNKRRLVVVLSTVTTIYFMSIFLNSSSKRMATDDHHSIITMPTGTRKKFNGSRGKTASETKLILFWTNWFGTRFYDWHFGLGREPFDRWTCPVRNCEVTRDKNLYEQADMVVFNFYEDDFTTAGFPPRRWSDQLYVFVISESPATVSWPANTASKFNGFFNLSMTYRHDSDIRYNHIVIERRNHSNEHDKIQEWIDIRNRIVARTTKVPVVWMVSNCRTRSMRHHYVRELRKYVDVEVYGICGTFQCGDNRGRQFDCYNQLQKKYKFYLSFENSECKDYVTEKLANVLPLDLVPIVLGGTNYSRDSPPHSVINVYNFSSTRELAAYIRELDNNMEKYLEYFKWKLEYKVLNGSIATPMSYCKLCEILHDKNFPRTKVVEDMAAFWPSADKLCRPKAFRNHLGDFREQFPVFDSVP